jgi:hypothetical protein
MLIRRLALLSLFLLTACENRPGDAASSRRPGTDSDTARTASAGAVDTSTPFTVGTTTSVVGQTYGHIRVSIKKATIGKVPLKAADGSISYADEPRLMIALRIENVSDRKQSGYNTWVPDLDAAKTVAKLTDDRGAELKRVTFGFGNNVQGRTVLDTLSPGKVIGDLLVFEAPAAGTKSLKLVLPGANCGVKDSFEFEIDMTTVARPK